jgi:hypothetical protein
VYFVSARVFAYRDSCPVSLCVFSLRRFTSACIPNAAVLQK